MLMFGVLTVAVRSSSLPGRKAGRCAHRKLAASIGYGVECRRTVIGTTRYRDRGNGNGHHRCVGTGHGNACRNPTSQRLGRDEVVFSVGNMIGMMMGTRMCGGGGWVGGGVCVCVCVCV